MKMHVEDLLTGGFTVGKEEVHTLASDVGASKCSGGALPDAEEIRSIFRIEVGEKRGMLTRHNEHMPTDDRLDVHEYDGTLAFMDEADLRFACRKRAK